MGKENKNKNGLDESLPVPLQNGARLKKKKGKKKGQERFNREKAQDQKKEQEKEFRLSSQAKKKKKKTQKESQRRKRKSTSQQAQTNEPPTKRSRTEAVEELEVTVSGRGSENFGPILDFEAAKALFSADTLEVCSDFEKPTPIQANCWSVLAAGRDIIGIAETGSGKTLAFLLPAFKQILKEKKKNPKKKRPTVLVLAPTRELAQQTDEVCLDDRVSATSVVICGGMSKRDQLNALRSGVDIVVGTPGRLLSMVQEKSLDLSEVTYLVLDEADRMLDFGFEEDVRAIISAVPDQRQTAMFSATWPECVKKIAREFFKDPIKITVGSDELLAAQTVTQLVDVVDPAHKSKKLLELLRKYHTPNNEKVLIFALYKKEAASLEKFLSNKGFSVASIHGDKAQSERNEALTQFKSGEKRLLVGTDVASRGLDIPNVNYVINLTFPLTIEDYVHRIGRTGRAGSTGTAHTLFTIQDKSHAGELQNLLRDSNQPIPPALMKFDSTVKKKAHPHYGHHYRAFDPATMPKAVHLKF